MTSAASHPAAAPAASADLPEAHKRERWYPPPQGEWTYEDYLHQPDDGFRYEVIEGNLYMAAAPATGHQRIASLLNRKIGNYLDEHHLGEVFPAPVDVLMGEAASPVEPDLVVVLKERVHIVKEKFIEGAPDLVVEVLSPSTAKIDRRQKYRIYSEQGVREYWMVDLSEKVLEIFVLRGEAYSLLGKYVAGMTTESEVLPGLRVKVDEVFAP